MKKNYCIVGLGERGINMFGKDLVGKYRDVANLTGICDTNQGRVALAQEQLGSHVKGFTDFDEMLNEVDCDVVIVTTRDSVHHEYIVRALRRGKDVITEKPMTIDEDKCRQILNAERETGHQVQVTFNYRYAPYKTKVKELLKSGIVGEIHSVEFRWYLDTVHGEDYFHRWHSRKENSGGLFVHKATHHFDLVNWWLDLEPIEVAAMGSRQYYIPERKPNHGERCSTCAIAEDCEFRLDLGIEPFQQLYQANEQYDGYHRDGCVFSEDVDIEDTMTAIVRYPKGIHLTYALTAATPFEGWQVAFNGSKGRLEAFEPENYVVRPNQDVLMERASPNVRKPVDWRTATAEEARPIDKLTLRFYPLFGGVETFELPLNEMEITDADHGGGDVLLKDDLFLGTRPDVLGHRAGSRAGAMSILVGVAANHSMKKNRFIRITDLVPELKEPLG